MCLYVGTSDKWERVSPYVTPKHHRMDGYHAKASSDSRPTTTTTTSANRLKKSPSLPKVMVHMPTILDVDNLSPTQTADSAKFGSV